MKSRWLAILRGTDGDVDVREIRDSLVNPRPKGYNNFEVNLGLVFWM